MLRTFLVKLDHWACFLDVENTYLVVEVLISQQAIWSFLFLPDLANSSSCFLPAAAIFCSFYVEGSFIINLGFKSRTRTSNPNSVVTSGGVYILSR